MKKFLIKLRWQLVYFLLNSARHWARETSKESYWRFADKAIPYPNDGICPILQDVKKIIGGLK